MCVWDCVPVRFLWGCASVVSCAVCARAVRATVASVPAPVPAPLLLCTLARACAQQARAPQGMCASVAPRPQRPPTASRGALAAPARTAPRVPPRTCPAPAAPTAPVPARRRARCAPRARTARRGPWTPPSARCGTFAPPTQGAARWVVRAAPPSSQCGVFRFVLYVCVCVSVCARTLCGAVCSCSWGRCLCSLGPLAAACVAVRPCFLVRSLSSLSLLTARA